MYVPDNQSLIVESIHLLGESLVICLQNSNKVSPYCNSVANNVVIHTLKYKHKRKILTLSSFFFVSIELILCRGYLKQFKTSNECAFRTYLIPIVGEGMWFHLPLFTSLRLSCLLLISTKW